MLLAELQQDFLKAFQDNDQNDAFLKHIKADAKLSASERLKIYQDGITASLANALREAYPACEKLVGEDFFLAMAYRYIELYPSTTPNLFDYGDQFAEFVANFEPAQALPYLVDICHLEWAYQTAYYAPNEEALDGHALAQACDTSEDDIIFKLPLSSYLLKSNYPIYDIWLMTQDNTPDDFVADLNSGGEQLIVWRQGVELKIEKLSIEQWLLLSGCAKAMKFSQLCDQLLTQQATLNLNTVLATALERGWIASFSKA